MCNLGIGGRRVYGQRVSRRGIGHVAPQYYCCPDPFIVSKGSRGVVPREGIRVIRVVWVTFLATLMRPGKPFSACPTWLDRQEAPYFPKVHNLRVPSSLPLAILFPSGEKLTLSTPPLWDLRVGSICPVATSQTRTSPFQSTAAIRFPSGEKAIPSTVLGPGPLLLVSVRIFSPVLVR